MAAADAEVEIDVATYLARIGHRGSTAVSASCLAELQTAHMIAVPFENLHVVAGLSVGTEISWSYPKVVHQRRGGWCFELNGAFGALLEAVGFAVTYHSARVWDPEVAELGPELDHLCLLVHADGERWLVDVGFGDSSVTPVQFDTTAVQHRRPRDARIEHGPNGVLYRELVDGSWETQYAIDLAPRGLGEFQARSDALAAGAGRGYFTTKPFATRALDATGGRVWLLSDRLKLASRAGGRTRIGPDDVMEIEPDDAATDEPVSADAWAAALARWFGITLPTRGYGQVHGRPR